MTLRHRLMPSPITSVALLLAWLMLNESASPGQWLLGALLALTIPWMLLPLRPARSPLRSWRALMRLVIMVLWDIVRSNLDAAGCWYMRCMRRTMQPPPRSPPISNRATKRC